MSLATQLPMPCMTTGSLESYIQTVNSMPILSAEEEFELATRFEREHDLEAARQLVLSHLRVVVSVARGFAGYGLPQADLIQEGNIGLMKAVKRYNPERGVRLVSFALHWIRAEIHEYVVKNWRLVKIATTKAQRKLFFNLRSMKQGLEVLDAKQVTEIATQLNVSEQDVVDMEARFAGQEVSVEPDYQDGEETGLAPIHYLTAGEEHEPSYMLEHAEREQRYNEGLAEALDELDSRSRRIIEARWLHDGDAATLHDLAAEFGVSAERIRQIEQKAFAKIQSKIKR